MILKVDWNPADDLILLGAEDCRYKVSDLSHFANFKGSDLSLAELQTQIFQVLHITRIQ